MMLQHSGWNALYLENHDQSRTVSRFASDAPQHRKVAAKMLATFLALQSGTPYIYQGQEIGQVNVPREWGLDRYRDIETLNHWQKVLREHPNDVGFQKMMLEQYRLKARDNARTPMQWDGKSKNAGFTAAKTPWMDVHPDYEEWNVQAQIGDPDSVFSHWKDVLALRKGCKDVFVYGGFEMLDPENEDLVAYVRTFDGRNRALVLTSFRDTEVDWVVPDGEVGVVESILEGAEVRLRNYQDGPKLVQEGRGGGGEGRGGGGGGGGDEAKRSNSRCTITLRPFEALVFVKSSG